MTHFEFKTKVKELQLYANRMRAEKDGERKSAMQNELEKWGCRNLNTGNGSFCIAI